MEGLSITLTRRHIFLSSLILVAGFVLVGCRPDPTPAPPPSDAGPSDSASSVATLVFPQEWVSEDPEVNAVVRRTMGLCGAGDYEGFIALWSRQEQPISPSEFERGWKAVREIQLLELQPFRTTEEGPINYFVRASAALDPAVPEPHRQVRLVLHRDDGEWRWRRAPEGLELKLKPLTTSRPSREES